MATNKPLTSKEAALKNLEHELQAINELSSKLNDQLHRLEIERLDMESRKGQNTACSSDSINQTTHDPNIIHQVHQVHQVSSEIAIPVDLEYQQINVTNLNLSMTAGLELGNNYEENSENEDST